MPGEGAGYSGYSGSPFLVYPGGVPTIQGFQVSGSDLVDGEVTLGLRFTAADVEWIEDQADGYLTAIPEPSTGALLALGLSLLKLHRRRRQRMNG